MLYNNIEVNVLIRGRCITEYPHNGETFIEGRHGSEFGIQVTNRNSFAVEAIVSVDGLSVTDGQTAGPNSSGYKLDAGRSITIPGWKLSDKAVSAFEFALKSSSYAAQTSGGDTANVGVIGVLVYREKRQYGSAFHGLVRSGYIDYTDNRWDGGTGGGMPFARGISTCGTSKGIPNTTWGGLHQQGYNNAISSNATLSCTASTATAISATASLGAAEQPVQQLGTAFGHETSFATTSVAFERGDMLAMIVLRYDDKRSLAKRGIVMDRYQTRTAPQAFPGMNCQPPAGWKG